MQLSPLPTGPRPGLPPDLTSFPEDLPLIVYDGHCGMCSAWVRLILRADGARFRHRFASAQSPLGIALYHRFGLPTDSYTTLLLVEAGTCRTKSDAILAILGSLGGAWAFLAHAMRRIPASWLDRGYDVVARNRHRVWGRLEACHVPPPGTEGRFIR